MINVNDISRILVLKLFKISMLLLFIGLRTLRISGFSRLKTICKAKLVLTSLSLGIWRILQCLNISWRQNCVYWVVYITFIISFRCHLLHTAFKTWNIYSIYLSKNLLKFLQFYFSNFLQFYIYQVSACNLFLIRITKIDTRIL